MHIKQYEFLNELVGDLFSQPKKALVRQGERGSFSHASVVPGRIKISRSTVMSCKDAGYITIGTQYVEITEAGQLAVCDYRKRFAPDER